MLPRGKEPHIAENYCNECKRYGKISKKKLKYCKVAGCRIGFNSSACRAFKEK